MRNFESGERLLKDAEIHYEQMLQVYEKGRWNIVVRRAQEVVELSLKALLKMLGVEYPKVHDIAPLAITLLKQRGIDMGEVFEEIREISDSLAKERAPAFYGEKIYSREQAKKARRGAEEVLNISKELSKRLKGAK